MNPLAEELETAVRDWDERGWPRPDAVVVTGSAIEVALGEPVVPACSLAELLPFEIHAVEGHTLSVELYRPLENRVTMYLRGRLHCYQGFNPHQVVFAPRLGALLGAQTLVQTNAAGSLRRDVGPGRLVAIRDHINLTGLSPLVGELPESWGPRFPPMNEAYAADLIEIAAECAQKAGLDLDQGVYSWFLGPSYETPAEIQMAQRLGADLVGMSTVPEVIAARQMGMRCLAVSVVTNLAAGLSSRAPSHQEVVAAGERAAARMQTLLGALVRHPDLCPRR